MVNRSDTGAQSSSPNSTGLQNMSKSDPGRPDQNALSQLGSDLDREDVETARAIEEADNGNDSPHTASISSSSSSAEDRIVISFSPDDPGNPLNWSTKKKTYTFCVGISTVINSTLGSALPSNATTYIADDFHITIQEQLVLPISIYLIGYVVGPLFLGPLSEAYGRRIMMIAPFSVFTIFTMACALAPNWPALIVFRFIVGVMASSPVSVVGGLFADIYGDPVTRGRAMALFMAATTLGPLLAPIISGFVSVVSWRWTFWIGLIVAGVSWLPVYLLPESYGPVILKQRAAKMRKEQGKDNIFAPIELSEQTTIQMLVRTLTRPLRMIIFESIVLFTCLYLSLCYALFYLFFESYPIIFQGTYGMSTGISGLAFLPIGVGAFIACGLFVWYDSILQQAKQRRAPWAMSEEYRRLPLACVGGPIFSISLFWLGWSARADVHWIVPMLAGIPFGIGFLLIFMAFLNYLTDAYETFAASALAAASCCRSIFGAVLPFAAQPMYAKLGVDWASSLLGFLSLGMVIIPFVFIRYGDRIRANSKFCQYLKEQKTAAESGGQPASPAEAPPSRDEEEKG
ncbi:MAG: hypothetical protein M4579_004528 [Chaenotheca gracillima]|nr:MAG: hypothetical protein M4579_004528 [Chaenotheca gracillima]